MTRVVHFPAEAVAILPYDGATFDFMLEATLSQEETGTIGTLSPCILFQEVLPPIA